MFVIMAVAVLVALTLGYVLAQPLHPILACLLAGIVGAPAAFGLKIMASTIIGGDKKHLRDLRSWEVRGLLLMGSLGGVLGAFGSQFLRD